MASSRRDLIYRMTADPQGFRKGMEAAGQSSRGFYKELDKLQKQQEAANEVMDTAGPILLGFGATAAVGLGLAAKAAVDWESAWTGVSKVVDGSPEQLAALEMGLRDLATTLPQTHDEIAAVAASAGQLGIAREDIADFTSTMVAMGTATNLSSDEAATSLARLMNIMQTAPDEVDRLGSAVVGLGNAGASTEAEIVDMALRIAGAGQTVGMTEADVLGFASALASVGIEAEAGGSSISVAMVKISEYVNKGGESLQTLADVAGVSAQSFAAQWRDDPAAAINAFVQGLGRMQASGGDVFAVLESLGMSEIRLRDALLRLANAGNLLTESIEIGNTAWDENSALMDEAARRYGTTEAQIQIARNQLVDLGIDLGETLLPVIQKFLDVGTGLMSFFRGLPEPAQTTIVVLGILAATVGIVGGAMTIAVPKVHALNMALLEMGTKRASRAQRALSGVTSVLTGPWGLAIGGAVTLLGMFVARQAESEARVDELSSTLNAQTGAVTDNTRAWLANELQRKGLFDVAKQLGISQADLVDAVITGNEEIVLQNDRVLELAGNVSNLSDEEKILLGDAEELRFAISGLNGEYQQAKDKSENQRAALEGQATATETASGSTQVLAEQLGITTEAAETASDGFQQLNEKVRALIDSAFALSGAQRDVEAGIDDLTEKLDKNGSTFDINTQAGRDNEAAVEALVEDIANLAITTAEQTGSAEEANDVLNEQKDRLHDVLEQAGLTEEQIDNYIGVLDDIPAEIETIVEANVNINTTEHLNRIITEEFGGNAAQIVEREGGIVHHARRGLLREAGIYSEVFPARFAFAEMGTGGEAFVPKVGDRSRSLGILQEAASWYRASVVPNESAGRVVNVYLSAYSEEFNLQQVMDDLAARGVS